jgi:class 3 adenylate cyclase/tetratricopeptide (TPR) repeat protein
VSAGGEQRHLTILFCDLVGSVTLTSQLDPEEWRATVASYQRAASEAITRFGGEVMRYVGDGIMVFFGYPIAHDDEAERAARAGLAILDAISQLNEQPTHQKLAVRIGIDSGPVVVGTGAGQAVDAFGDAANISARVQATAEAQTVVVTGATHRLISGLFVVEDRGAQTLKGISQPVQLYRVVRPSGIRSRFEAASAAGGLTPFVGREGELRLLLSRWERARDGEGQVVTIIGEAGIGKSRLVRHFREQIADTPHTSLEAGGGAFFQNTPFYPVSEMLRQVLGGATELEQLAQLGARLTAVGLKPAEAIPLLAPMLSLSLPPDYPPSILPPEQQRRRLLATLVEWLIGAARTQPLVSVIEDLHWADPSTLELIQLLVEQGATAPLMLIYTARPEFSPPWPLRAHHTQLTLNRLSAREVRTIISEVAARKALSDETIAIVVERTSGVPLFVEELTHAVLESGDGKLIGRSIPVTLHDSLMARLDRLGPAKEVIQIGAVIGGEFSYELLHAVHPINAEALQGALQSATDAELIYVRGMAPEATYQFKHALIRDAAYETLLKSRRKELHGRVAKTINEQFSGLKKTHPGVVAHHWTEAGETAQAIAEWSRAGNAHESHHAFKEAQQSYQQRLALLSLLPDSPERDLHELEARQSIIRMLLVTTGINSPEGIDACARAVALAEKSGNISQLTSFMYAAGFAAHNAGDHERAATLANQALELAEREVDPANLAAVYHLQIWVRFFRGDLSGCEEHFARGLKFFEDAAICPFPMARLEVVGVASFNAWLLGRADLARERLVQMTSTANQNSPADAAWSGWLGASLYLLMRENERAEVLAARAVELLEKHEMALFAAGARCALGLARAELGRPVEGIALIRQGMTDLAALGMHLDAHIWWLAIAQTLEGAIEDALETIEQVLAPDRPEANMVRPEAFRVRGELQTKLGRIEAAEADFRTALTAARRMRAKVWELRATMSLARLLRDTDRRDEAYSMLSNIYDWFTEGFDTADLKDAKALLDNLSAQGIPAAV